MKDPQAQLDKFAKNKDIQKDIDYFKSKSAKFTSVDELLKDRKATRILLSAYDLQDEINALGRIRKVLTEDPTASTALSAKLADSRFAAMAKDLRLDQNLSKLKSGLFLEKVEDRYVQSEFEQALGRQDPALREAAYFARNAASKTSSVYGILGDKILRNVVSGTLNLPPQLAIQSVETQARAITSRLKIEQFATEIRDAGGISASQIKTAREDAGILENNLKISDAAIKQVTALQTAINKAVADYDAFASRTIDPAENAAQQTAIPQLLRFEQLLKSGGAAITATGQNIQKLQQLVTDAGDPANSGKLSSYKTKFAALIDTIASQIDNSNVRTPSDDDVTNGPPATENIFKFAGNAVLTAQAKADGTKNIDINVFDTSDLSNALTAAKDAFAALSGPGDNANLAAASNRLSAALTRSSAIQATIAGDTAKLTDRLDDVTYGATLDSAALLKGKRSLDDALARTATIAGLLEQIGTLAETSAARNSGADRTDMTAKFEALRTKLYDTINTPGSAGLDNLLTAGGQAQYRLLTRPASGGGTEDINLFASGVKSGFDDIITALDAASVGDKASAQALSLKALQLTNRTDAATTSLNADRPAFARAVGSYDPKAKIDAVFFDIQTKLDATIAAAAVGASNLLSSDQSDISFAVTSSTETLKLHAAKTFKSDVAAQLQNVVTAFAGGLSATRSAASALSSIVDRTARYLGTDNRNLSFEQGRIGVILDTLDADTAEDGTSRYKVNSFTEKFLMRYLTLNGSNGPTFTSSQAAGLNLFTGTASAGSILSLSLSV